jgi:hypothetical protein
MHEFSYVNLYIIRICVYQFLCYMNSHTFLNKFVYT